MKPTIISIIACVIIFSCNRNVNNKSSEHASVASFAKSKPTPEENYVEYCGSCHGMKMDAFVDRSWKYGKSASDLYKGIAKGYVDDGMPSFEVTFSDTEIKELVKYIQGGISNVDDYYLAQSLDDSQIYESEELSFRLDTIASGIQIPWGLAFLPDGDILITERGGTLYRRSTDGQLHTISGIPEVKSSGQGGLLEITLHPDYETNGWIYIGFSKPHPNGKRQATTAVVRGRVVDDQWIDQEDIFEALPYSSTRHHYGTRMSFGDDGMLYISVGDRGNRDQNPQNLDNHCGKIHRLKDDGSIPKDNPFVNQNGAIPSIYSYGHRNPQGLSFNPTNGSLWANEHGPRGGDEINIVQKGKNYGWPTISYGINYNGTTFTDLTEHPDMEQPVMYWLPSIGVCGMTFIDSDKYGPWQNNLLSGSLRFNYLERAVIKNDKVIHKEKLLENLGRLRVVEIGADGYIYVGVEKPGYVFRLMPILE